MIMFQVTGADVHTREIMFSFQLLGNLVGPKAVMHYLVLFFYTIHPVVLYINGIF